MGNLAKDQPATVKVKQVRRSSDTRTTLSRTTETEQVYSGVYGTVYTSRCTHSYVHLLCTFLVYTSSCTLPGVHFSVYTYRRTLLGVHFSAYTSLCTLPGVHLPVYTSRCILPGVHFPV
ncbi:hypothetical protein F2Q69_00060186 [Brassica cretica]|uniref:Uncharacterized protein n=1 Tax=Brassica cretica TaxID=69181 RepID=A0A8S9RNK8_BRACR|nr:hypothetical protein F2Q69_00060186 [Brassica cretica]